MNGSAGRLGSGQPRTGRWCAPPRRTTSRSQAKTNGYWRQIRESRCAVETPRPGHPACHRAWECWPPASGRSGTIRLPGPENVFTISQGIALECNRDEWMPRMRRMGFVPMQAAGASKLLCHGPISLPPEARRCGRAVCGVAALVQAQAIHCALRLASHPVHTAARPLGDRKHVLKRKCVALLRIECALLVLAASCSRAAVQREAGGRCA